MLFISRAFCSVCYIFSCMFLCITPGKLSKVPPVEVLIVGCDRYTEVPVTKAGNHVVLMIGFTKFRAGIRTKHVRK